MPDNQQEQLNTRAIEIAAETKGALKGHEDRCGEWYKRISDDLKGIRDRQDSQDAKRSDQTAAIFAKIDAIKDDAWSWRRSAYVGAISVVCTLLAGAVGLLLWLLANGAPFVRVPG